MTYDYTSISSDIGYFRKSLYSNKKLFILTLFLCSAFLYIIILIYSTPENVQTIEDYQKSMVLIMPSPDEYSNITDDTWRYIGNEKNRFQIYSAYFDSRPEILTHYSSKTGEYLYGSVRVFAILSTSIKSKIYCNIIHDEGQFTQVPVLQASPIRENYGLEFSAYTIVCPLINRSGQSTIVFPKYVALSFAEDQSTLTHPTFIVIKYNLEKLLAQPNRTLAICTGPIHNNYNEARRLVEFIHIYRIQGAEKLYFYNLNATHAVNDVLEHFERQGFIENLEWNLYGYEFEKELRYAGIFAALNECVYRATFVDGFKYVALVDLDEILMSFKYLNLAEYIDSMANKKRSSYVFRGVFFHDSDEIDLSGIPNGIKNNFLYTQSKTLRTSDPFPTHVRSKYIVNARAAIEMGNHFIWQSIKGFSEETLPIEDALLFHYRNECLSNTCKTKRSKDFTLRRYGSLLWEKVERSCKEIFPDGICPIKG